MSDTMDPLSVAAPVIVIIALAGHIVSACQSYIMATDDAANDLQTVLMEVASVRYVFVKLETWLKNDACKQDGILEQLRHPHGPLVGCHDAMFGLHELSSSLTERFPDGKPSELATSYAKLAWRLQERKARHLLNDIRRHKATIMVILSTEKMNQASNVKTGLGKLHDTMIDAEKERILRWLGFVDPSPEDTLARQWGLPGTGEWLMRCPEYKDWITGSTRLLWLHGPPGAGKTVLASVVIKSLDKLFHGSTPADTTYAYYYCDFLRHQDETPNLLRWLLNRLCRQSKEIPMELRDLCGPDGKSGINELMNALAVSLCDFRQVYLVVDALDESLNRHHLTDFLRAIYCDLRFEKIKVIAFSRKERDIERALERIAVQLSVQDHLRSEDIRLYIQRYLLDGKLRKWPSSLQAEIEEALVGGAHGIIRWVSCQLKALRELNTISAVRHALRELNTISAVIHALRLLLETLDEIEVEDKPRTSQFDSEDQDNPPRDKTDSTNKPIPSDSGYHSGLGTDTKSVCSMGSVGSSLGLSREFLQEFIAFFEDVLTERAGARAWAGYALAHHPPEVVKQRLDGMLKDYALELLSSSKVSDAADVLRKLPNQPGGSNTQIAFEAAKLIRRYRPNIASCFHGNALSAPITANTMASRLRELGEQLSLDEKLDLFNKATPIRAGPDKAIDDVKLDEEVEDDVRDHDYLADLKPDQEYLVSGEAFQNLVTAMRRSFYHNDRSALNRIESEILKALSTAEATCPSCSSSNSTEGRCSDHGSLHSVRFNLHWDLLGFLRSQFGSHTPRLGSLVTLTGSAMYALATTCSEYLRITWPGSGSFFLTTLQTALDLHEDVNNEANSDNTACVDGLDLRISIDNTSCGDDASPSRVSVDARGVDRMLVELAQQLAWIGAVLTSSPYDEKVAYSKAVIKSDGSTKPLFTVEFQFEPLHTTEDPCWLPLFCGASIARGFPVPERQGEMGLEIPLEIMAGIAGVRHAVEYKGGVVLKGFSSMFVPIKRRGDRVQWHLISSPDCEVRISYQEAIDHCRNRATLDEVSLDCLRTTRAIVGWCSAATSVLGSDNVKYENIDYSGAEAVQSPLNITGGTLGVQHFGVAQLNFALAPKDGKCHFQRRGPYKRIISAAEKTPVVLYDTAEKRAWLVPASSVMLHIAHHRNWLEPVEVGGKRVGLPATSSFRPSAKEVLFSSASMVLSDGEEYTYKHMIIDIWSILEYLIDQDVQEDQTSGATIKGTLRDVVRGFEFKAVVEERSPFRRKQTTIEKSSGGWPVLVRDIDALVLFASGYQDIILPASDQMNAQGLCNLWRSVPKWKDYLATSVQTLKDLYDVAGCRLGQEYLTSSRLRWHRGSSLLFEPCKRPRAYRCGCNRLQQVVPKSAIGPVVPPGPLVDDGAVIFGQSESSLRGWISNLQIQGSNNFYSQPNVSLAPTNIRQEPDHPSSSGYLDSEPTTRSGSDATSNSTVSSNTTYGSQESALGDSTRVKRNQNHVPCAIQRSCTSEESVLSPEVQQPNVFPPTPSRQVQVTGGSDIEGFQQDHDMGSGPEEIPESCSHAGKWRLEETEAVYKRTSADVPRHMPSCSRKINQPKAMNNDDDHYQQNPAASSSCGNPSGFTQYSRRSSQHLPLRRRKNFSWRSSFPDQGPS